MNVFITIAINYVIALDDAECFQLLVEEGLISDKGLEDKALRSSIESSVTYLGPSVLEACLKQWGSSMNYILTDIEDPHPTLADVYRRVVGTDWPVAMLVD